MYATDDGVPHGIQPSSHFMTKSVRQGSILTPSPLWIKDVSKMYRLFMKYHPLPNLIQGPGLIKNFVHILQKEFPNRQQSLLKEFALLRTNLQIKKINEIAKFGKRSTVRGAKKLVETINA